MFFSNKMHHLKLYHLAWFLLIIFLLILYFNTICPDVYVGDSGEFVVAAEVLGIPHNPGYPLYNLFGKFFILLINNHRSALAVNLLSSFCIIIAAIFLYLTSYYLSKNVLVSFLAALLFSTSNQVWSVALNTEVYGLNVALCSILFFFLVKNIQVRSFKWFLSCVFLSFLALANHLSLLLLIPSFLILSTSTITKHFKNRKFIFQKINIIIVFIILACSTYLYLPLRASTNPILNWGNCSTFNNLFKHVSAQEHRSRAVFSLSGQEYAQRFKDLLKMFSNQFPKIALIFIFMGIFYGSKHYKIIFFSVLIGILGDIFYTSFLNTVPLEATSFGIPSIWLFCIFFNLGLSWLYDQFKQKYYLLKTGILLIVFLTILFNIKNQWLSVDRNQCWAAYDYAKNMLLSLPAKAKLVVEGDNQTFLLLYMLSVHHLRPDILIQNPVNKAFLEVKAASNEHTSNWENAPLFFGNYNDSKETAAWGILYRDTKVAPPKMKDLNSYLWSLYKFRAGRAKNFQNDILLSEIFANYYLARALYYENTGNLENAEIDFKSASDFGENVYFIHFRLGLHAQEKGELALAEKEFHKVLKLKPDYTEAYENLANIYLEKGDLENFNKYINSANQFGLSKSRSCNLKGMLAHRQGEIQKAEALFYEAIKADPQNSAAYFNLGNVLKKQEKNHQAEEAYLKSLEINPNNADALNNLGNLYKSIGNYQSALEMFQKALEIDPNYIGAHNNLGLIYAALGKYQEAFDEYNQVLKVEPENPAALCNLGSLFAYGYKDFPKAVFWWGKYLEKQPNSPQAQQIQLEIKKFQKSLQ